jgi:hypothetical protein
MRKHLGMFAAVGFMFIAGSILAPSASIPGGLAAAAGFTYPKGRVGEIAQSYIVAFSSGEDSLMTVFHATYLSEEMRGAHPLDDELWQYQRLYGMLGTLSPQQVVRNKGSELVLLAKSETLGSWFHLNIELDEGTPRMVRRLQVQPAPRPD